MAYIVICSAKQDSGYEENGIRTTSLWGGDVRLITAQPCMKSPCAAVVHPSCDPSPVNPSAFHIFLVVYHCAIAHRENKKGVSIYRFFALRLAMCRQIPRDYCVFWSAMGAPGAY
jgi:hypothetical protein